MSSKLNLGNVNQTAIGGTAKIDLTGSQTVKNKRSSRI